MAVQRQTTAFRRVELVDAALQIIATQGVAALSTRALATSVGLTTGAIFRHFASLDELLEAVVSRVVQVLEETYPPADLEPVERLGRFIDARRAAVGARMGILRLVVSEQFMLALPRGGSLRLRRCVERSRAFVVECLRDAQELGSVRSDVPAEALALLVMGAVQTSLLHGARGPERGTKPGHDGLREALLTVIAPVSTAPPAGGRASRRPVRPGASLPARPRAEGRQS